MSDLVTEQRICSLAKGLVQKSAGTLTFEQAVEKVLLGPDGAELYEQYDREFRTRARTWSPY